MTYSYQGVPYPITASTSYSVKVDAEPFDHSQVSGKWLGQYHFYMMGIDAARNYGSFCPMDETGYRSCAARYSGAAGNIEPAYWLWDFNTGQVYMGSSQVLAFGGFIPYRLYAPTREKDARQIAPEVDPDTWQVIGTFTPSTTESNVYHVKFNKQVFFAFAGYSLARLELRMGVADDGDGTLSVGTLAGHPEDKLIGRYLSTTPIRCGPTATAFSQ